MAAKRMGGGDDNCALYLGDLPANWGVDELREFHREAGLPDGSLVDVKILPRRLPGETGCAILRYTDAESASSALLVIHGFPVETGSGQQRTIRARYADEKGQGQRQAKMARTNERSDWPLLPAPAQGSWGFQGMQSQQSQQSQQGSPTVYVSDVPSEFTEQSLQTFHGSLGLTPPVHTKFLPQKLSGLTGAVMMRYANIQAAHRAVARLNGHPVNLSTGTVRYLIAKLAEEPGSAQSGMQRGMAAAPAFLPDLPPEMQPGPGCDPAALYLADVPMGLDQGAMQRLHQDEGISPPSTTKYLPQKLDDETCCAIVRYNDAVSAQRAMQVLNNLSVKTTSGKAKFLSARYASLPKGQTAQNGHGSWSPAAPFNEMAFRDPMQMQMQPAIMPRGPVGRAGAGAGGGGGGGGGGFGGGGFGGGDEASLPSVYASDLPGDISEDGVKRLLSEVGLDASLLVAVKFLPRKIQANSLCVLLRYRDMDSVREAMEALTGHEVVLPDGTPRRVVARVADPPKGAPPQAAQAVQAAQAAAYASREAQPRAWSGRGAGTGPTDLYVSEVPVEWDDSAIAGLHMELGVDPGALKDVKILPRRHSSYPTGAAILRYTDHETAQTAMSVLDGRPVSIPGGQRHLVVRFADPPRRKAGAGGW